MRSVLIQRAVLHKRMLDSAKIGFVPSSLESMPLAMTYAISAHFACLATLRLIVSRELGLVSVIDMLQCSLRLNGC